MFYCKMPILGFSFNKEKVLITIWIMNYTHFFCID